MVHNYNQPSIDKSWCLTDNLDYIAHGGLLVAWTYIAHGGLVIAWTIKHMVA